ncbi:hypothetical protein AAMO2058_001109300, partial [Amorphochlora amoebiformis]
MESRFDRYSRDDKIQEIKIREFKRSLDSRFKRGEIRDSRDRDSRFNRVEIRDSTEERIRLST